MKMNSVTLRFGYLRNQLMVIQTCNVHHDIVLSAFPLCTAWLDCPLKGGETGNFIAVGLMEPSIEMWDLDIVDEVQPTIVLGGIIEKKKKKKKKTKKTSIKYKEGSHTDSVLGLAWNKEFRNKCRNVLASASADKLVKIWDVATGECKTTLEHHTDKVQAVAWNHHEPQVLLSGSFDRSVVIKDSRSKDPDRKWSVRADVESLAWDPHNNHSFVVSLEDGTVQGFDDRVVNSDSKPSFTLHAHDKEVCSVSYNPSVPNLLATGSSDKMVKLWDLSNNQPSCIASQNPKAGGVFLFPSRGTTLSCLLLEVQRANWKYGTLLRMLGSLKGLEITAHRMCHIRTSECREMANPFFHARTKYIELDYHSVCGFIHVRFISIDVDILTKYMSSSRSSILLQ